MNSLVKLLTDDDGEPVEKEDQCWHLVDPCNRGGRATLCTGANAGRNSSTTESTIASAPRGTRATAHALRARGLKASAARSNCTTVLLSGTPRSPTPRERGNNPMKNQNEKSADAPHDQQAQSGALGVATGSVRPRARRTSPLLLASLALLASGGVPDYGRLVGHRPNEPRQKTQADLDALAAAEAKRKRKADRKASEREASPNAVVRHAEDNAPHA